MKLLTFILTLSLAISTTALAEVAQIVQAGEPIRVALDKLQVEFDNTRFEIELTDENGNDYRRSVSAVVKVSKAQLEWILVKKEPVFIVYQVDSFKLTDICFGPHLVEQIQERQYDGTVVTKDKCVVIEPSEIIFGI